MIIYNYTILKIVKKKRDKAFLNHILLTILVIVFQKSKFKIEQSNIESQFSVSQSRMKI